MSFVSEYLTPFFKWYDRKLDGQYIATQLQFKGSKDVGGSYSDKIKRAQKRSVEQPYDETLAAVKNPSLSSFLEDNIIRLALNPFDRLAAAYAAYPSLKARFSKPGTFSHTFTEIMNEGLIFGAFKGFIYNFAQVAFVLYPSVYFANKNGSDSKYLTFLSTYTVLDALFYPVDTLKNILYADTLGKYNIKTATNSIRLVDLYRGLTLKLAYNIPVLSGYYCTTQAGCETEALLAWALAFILYPLQSQKIRAQVSAASALSSINANTSPVTRNSFQGALLYVAINALIGYSLRPLFAKEKVEALEMAVDAKLKMERLR